MKLINKNISKVSNNLKRNTTIVLFAKLLKSENARSKNKW